MEHKSKDPERAKRINALAKKAKTDESVFEELCEEVLPFLGNLFLNIRPPGMDEDDIHQIGRICIWRGLKTYKPRMGRGMSFTSWAYLLTRRTLISQLDRECNHQGCRALTDSISLETPLEEAGEGTVMDILAAPEDIVGKAMLEWPEQRAHYMDRLKCAGLAAFERKVLELYLDDPKMSYKKAAKQIGCSRKSIDNSWTRARKKIRERLGVSPFRFERAARGE